MLMLRRILALIGKELAMVWRDPKSRFVVIGPPIIQFFVFGYAATFDLNDVRFAVFDESGTSESRAFIAAIEGSPTFRLVETLHSEREIDTAIDRQEVRIVVHVPQDFAERLHDGRTAPVQVIADGRNSNVASIALGYVNAIAQQQNLRLASERAAAVAGVEGADGTAQAALLLPVERAWFNENLESRWYIASALGGVISMVVVLLLASLSVAREREFGTFDQLLVAPLRPGEILIGKATPSLAFGLADALLLSAAAVFWFQVPFRGTVLALIVALCAFMLAVVGIGLFISALSGTMQQALLGSFVFIMPAVILGGFVTPIANMPGWLQTATLINPLRYVVDALRQVFLVGADTQMIWPDLWPMLVIASLTLPAAAWMFRHRTG